VLYKRFIGYTEAEWMNLDIEDVTHAVDREWTRSSYQEIVAGKRQETG
jgi:hypothetical protein